MSIGTLARPVAALGAVAVLAVGTAVTAHAATPITQEHADIVYIEATDTVGSSFDQDGIGFVSPANIADFPVVFDNAGWQGAGNGSLYDAGSGAYVIPNDHDIEELLPYLGLNFPAGNGSHEYEVAASLTAGQASAGDVRFVDGATVALDTADPSATVVLTAGTHRHFELQLDGAGAGTETYHVTFEVTDLDAPANSRSIDAVLQVTN